MTNICYIYYKLCELQLIEVADELLKDMEDNKWGLSTLIVDEDDYFTVLEHIEDYIKDDVVDQYLDNAMKVLVTDDEIDKYIDAIIKKEKEIGIWN
jgi:Mg/Co/Ni transporter MgtE